MAEAEQLSALLPPSHRLDELRPVIPWQVALLLSPPPLHQPVPSSPLPAATVNRDPTKVVGFSTGIMRKFQPVLTVDRFETNDLADHFVDRSVNNRATRDQSLLRVRLSVSSRAQLWVNIEWFTKMFS